MIFVAISAIAAAALMVAATFGVVRWTFRTLERKDRVHEARVNALLDRTMHALGKTWEQPPGVKDALEGEDERQRLRAAALAGIVDPIEEPVPDFVDQLDEELIGPWRTLYAEERLADVIEPVLVDTEGLELT